MIAPPASRIAIGAAIIVVGSGAVLFIAHQGWRHTSPVQPLASAVIVVPPVVHTAAWYVAHPNILKQDEQRCAGDAATIPRAACQNVASADAQIAAGVFAKAAAQNGAAGARPPSAK